MKLALASLALVALTAMAQPSTTRAPADQFSPAVYLDNGEMPAIAIDSQRRIHLVFRQQKTLWYQVRDLGGNLVTTEEVSADTTIFDPRIYLDAEDHPHIVFADGDYKNQHTFYTNRINGQWLPLLDVFDRDREGLNRATMPTLAFEADGSALVAAFTVGDQTDTTKQWGMVARITDLATAPKVVVRRRIDVWNPQVFSRDGEIWIGGRNTTTKRRFTFQRHTHYALGESGEAVLLSGRVHGEAARAVLGASGDIHAAGATGGIGAADRGWYNSLNRAQAGLPPIRYLTSLENPSGMGMPVEDLKHPERVYVFHWSDLSGDTEEHEHKGCRDSEQLHFVRIENGEKASELNRLTDRTPGHGPHYRLTPAAVAHPDGGALVVFRECSGDLFLTRIGGE